MSNAILDGLSLVDAVGRTILASTLATLLGGVGAHAWLRGRYDALSSDLEKSALPGRHFSHPVLTRIVRECEDLAQRSREPNTQAIIEDAFQAELKPLLLAERFARTATGLVLVLGLLGTFYGLTQSIGKLAHLVASDSGNVADVTQAMTTGLTQALGGMAIAFSNSLLGVGSAVVLTVLGAVNNVTDRRTALMVQIEAYLDRVLSIGAGRRADPLGAVGAFGDSVARLEAAVARFESALQGFAASTKDLREVQLGVALKPGDGR